MVQGQRGWCAGSADEWVSLLAVLQRVEAATGRCLSGVQESQTSSVLAVFPASHKIPPPPPPPSWLIDFSPRSAVM